MHTCYACYASISIRTKIRLLRAIVISTALYGCEAWTLSAEMERRIQAFEFRCLRRVLKVPYTKNRTNVSIRGEITSIMGLHDPLLTIVKKRKMQCTQQSRQPCDNYPAGIGGWQAGKRKAPYHMVEKHPRRSRVRGGGLLVG